MDQVDALPLEAADEVLSEGAPDVVGGLLPFGFSKANQVVLERSDSGLVLSHVGKLQTDTLLEVRRAAGASFTLEEVDEATFQLRLSGAYQRNQNQAAQVAEDLSSDVDLAQLVDEIPDLGDLVDAEDDAPIIRLINAILSQAVKEQASDIHIETFEDDCPCATESMVFWLKCCHRSACWHRFWCRDSRLWPSSISLRSEFLRTVVFRSVLRAMQLIFECRPFHRPTGSAWFFDCSTSKQGSLSSASSR